MRVSTISPTAARQRFPVQSQGRIRSGAGRPRNHRASADAVSLLHCLPGVASFIHSAIACAMAAAARGGTAFPICLKAALGGPLKRKSSGNVWIRAASRTVSVRG